MAGATCAEDAEVIEVASWHMLGGNGRLMHCDPSNKLEDHSLYYFALLRFAVHNTPAQTLKHVVSSFFL